MKKSNGLKIGMAFLLAVNTMPLSMITTKAAESKISIGSAIGYSSEGFGPELAIDGNKATYFKTPAKSSMKDHYRTIDLHLDGVYDLSQIKIFNNRGSFNEYQIYASIDGSKFDKIGFKTNEEMPKVTGDVYDLKGVKGSIVRINLSYNSQTQEGNLAEVELYGTRSGDAKLDTAKIEVENFDDTKWKNEYSNVKSDKGYANEKLIQEMSNLVERVIGTEWKNSFIFETREETNNKDIFEIENGDNGKIFIRGNNGVSMASGFSYYLRTYCKVDYNPVFASNLNMPKKIVPVENKIVKETQYDYRYALNFCTYSYTMAFWGWQEYQAFLDWAAMSGINLMLDIVGQEEIIRRTLNEFGYTDQEVKEYISGPGYFAWYYMQNMSSFGGPLPNNWFEERVELGRKMHDRMQIFGITPALNGYAGMVPNDFKDKNPDAQIVDQGEWCGFERPSTLRTYVNKGEKDYFSEVADVFYQKSKEVFGDVTNYYAVDPFHEGGLIGDMDVTKVYETVQQKMINNNPDAIWIIQQWSGSMNDAKLSGIKKKDQAIVLDLFSEINPSSSTMEKNEIPWVWNMLHNFGGRMGLDGNPEKVSQNIPASFVDNNKMVGIGMTPEALENSPMMYELLWDMTWTKDPVNYREWVQKYAERNYGGTNDDIKKAWEILLDTGYNRKDNYYQGAAESVINARPNLKFESASSWGHSTINYDKEKLEEAVSLMAKHYEEFKDSPSFIYDLSDIVRQMIANTAQDYHTEMANAFQKKDLELFTKLSDNFIDMIVLQDKVLGTNEDFLVGKWIEQSRNMMPNMDDWTKDLFEFNARALITTWAGNRSSDWGLRDYSNRQWAGLTGDYYAPRWKKWVAEAKTAIINNTAIPSTNWFISDWQWANEKSDEGNKYVTSASGDSLETLANEAYSKYSILKLKEIVGSSTKAKVNLALGKTVISSVATNAEFPLSKLTDGKKDTKWAAAEKQNEFSLTVDLGGTKSIDGIDIALVQIAGGYPYSYKVEVFNEDKWVLAKETTNGEMNSNESVDYTGIGSKVKYTFKTTQQIIPEITELFVFGTEKEEEFTNIAYKKEAKVPGGTTMLVTDGNIDSRWVSGDGSYPAEVSIDLGNEQRAEFIEVYFEKPGLRYQYTVSVEDANGVRTIVQDKSENLDDLPKMYRIPVTTDVKKVFVNIISRAPGGEFYLAWPCIGEIKVLQKGIKEFKTENVALGKPVYLHGQLDTNATVVTDGKINNLYIAPNQEYPEDYVIDLGKEQFIENTIIYFEKAGIRFKFKVEIIDEAGKVTTVLDKSKNTEDLAASYDVLVNAKARKIKVNFLGRAEGGAAYLATPAIAEVMAFAKPENVILNSTISSNTGIEQSKLDLLKDTNIEMNISVDNEENKEFTFEFATLKDINGFELFNGNSSALQFNIEYQAENSEDWKMLVKKAANIDQSSKYISEFNSVLAKRVKLKIFNKKAEISEFKIYKSDLSNEVLTYISKIEAKLTKVSIGDFAGNYTKNAYDELVEKMNNVKANVGADTNSEQVKAYKLELDVAYKKFLNSYVNVDRTILLSMIEEIKSMLKLDYFKDMKFLVEAQKDAQLIYDTYKVTQIQINETLETLTQAKARSMSLLNEIEKYKVELQIVKDKLDSATIGDKEGNVSQDTFNQLENAIDDAIETFKSADTNEKIIAIVETLKTEAVYFDKNKVVIDKSELIAIIYEVELLNESDFTKDSWKILTEKLAIAKTVEPSISEIENAKNKLIDAKTHLIILNRNSLKDYIKTFDSYNKMLYSKNSWNNLVEKLEKAKDLTEKTSLNQIDLDTMMKQVEEAYGSLVKLSFESLKALIIDVKKMDASLYTNATWNKLINLVTSFDCKIEKVQLEVSEVKDMEKELKKEIDNLVKVKINAEKEDLEKLLKDASKYLYNQSFTPDSYRNFKSAYDTAQNILNDKNMTQEQVNESLLNLQNAIKELKYNDGVIGDLTDQDEASNSTNTSDSTNLMVLILLVLSSFIFIFKIKREKGKS